MIRLGDGRRGASEGTVSSSGAPTRQLALRRLAPALLAALVPLLAAGAPKGRPTPSGQPVPRYVATKFAVVNARSGPGDDYRLLWTFHARNLPLQVIAETEDWRRVCDPEGGVSWVHRRTVAEARTAIRTADAPLALRKRPSEAAPVAAMLAGRSIATLKNCLPGWCRLTVDHASGWAPEGEIWGAAEGFQCRGGAAPPG